MNASNGVSAYEALERLRAGNKRFREGDHSIEALIPLIKQELKG